MLVSLMLSSQTRDEVNHAAMTRLREAGLSVPWLRAVPEPELAQLVKPVGFWRVSAAGIVRARGTARDRGTRTLLLLLLFLPVPTCD